jgi:hypothetical protein
MTCRSAHRRLSEYIDGELPPNEARLLAAHLDSCLPCTRREHELRAVSEAVSALPRLEASQPVASRILDRLEMERRNPGLALLFRPRFGGGPFMLLSLIPAALVLFVVIAGAFMLDERDSELPPIRATGLRPSWEGALPPSGTEQNPLFPSSEISVPTVRARDPWPVTVFTDLGEGTLFLETVVGRDGSVAAVTVLDGDDRRAGPLLDAMRRDRFEPARYRGKPVAVSLYRLISSMEVRVPVT